MILYSITSATWLLLIGHLVPSLKWDHGIYASVAERLVAGDRLYSGVWDNKDPIFYWVLALGRNVSPVFDFVVEILWLALGCFAVDKIAKYFECQLQTRKLFAYAITPLILTGGIYRAGYSHLPGEVLLLAVVATMLNKKYIYSGLLLATLLMTKVLLVPVAFIAIVVIVALNKKHLLNQKVISQYCLGFIGAALMWLAILGYRHELVPYFNSLKLNFLYSASGAGNTSKANLLGPVFAHFLQAMSLSALIVLGTITLYLFVSRFDVRNKFKKKPLTDIDNLLWALSASTLLICILVILFTGIWAHHAQIYYVPAIFTGLLFSRRLTITSPVLTVKPLVALFISALLLGGTVHVEQFVFSDVHIVKNVSALNEIQPLTRELLARAPSSSYARAGTSDDYGHAYGLKKWHLACARFAQYGFDPPELLAKDANCLSKAQFIMVSPGFSKQSTTTSQPQTSYEHFLFELHTLLKTSYDCSRYPSGDICQQRIPK